MPLLKASHKYFLENDLSEYEGEWIAIQDDSVISHGKSLKDVVKEAESKSGRSKFLLVKVPTEETMIF